MTKYKKKSEHYVDNKEFLSAMIDYKSVCNKAEKAGKPSPPVTNYIGGCFLKIAPHLSYRQNFLKSLYNISSTITSFLFGSVRQSCIHLIKH